MLRFAICDDDRHELSRLSILLNQYRTERNATLQYDTYQNAVELLEAMKRQTYHALLLDVIMPLTSGIEAAREIRMFDEEIKIIFLTSSTEFAVESYEVDAHYYLLKPGIADKLFPILDKIFLDAQRAEDALHVKTPSGIVRLRFSRLEFLEVTNKKLLFHLDDGSVKEISGSLSDFEDQLLCRDEFIKVHRSYIVNLAYIQLLNGKELTTYTKRVVPVSRLLCNQVKEAYMQQLFLEKGVK